MPNFRTLNGEQATVFSHLSVSAVVGSACTREMRNAYKFWSENFKGGKKLRVHGINGNRWFGQDSLDHDRIKLWTFVSTVTQLRFNKSREFLDQLSNNQLFQRLWSELFGYY
jgi:hypothetical protein